MTTRIEHANLTVPDIDAAMDFLKTVAPEFRVMHDAISDSGTRWVHFGAGGTYLALEQPHDKALPSSLNPRYQNYGINHLGLIVADMTAVKARLEARGYHEGHIPEITPARIRRYFYDAAGMEWELVEYLSDDPDLRYHYVF